MGGVIYISSISSYLPRALGSARRRGWGRQQGRAPPALSTAAGEREPPETQQQPEFYGYQQANPWITQNSSRTTCVHGGVWRTLFILKSWRTTHEYWHPTRRWRWRSPCAPISLHQNHRSTYARPAAVVWHTIPRIRSHHCSTAHNR